MQYLHHHTYTIPRTNRMKQKISSGITIVGWVEEMKKVREGELIQLAEGVRGCTCENKAISRRITEYAAF